METYITINFQEIIYNSKFQQVLIYSKKEKKKTME